MAKKVKKEPKRDLSHHARVPGVARGEFEQPGSPIVPSQIAPARERSTEHRYVWGELVKVFIITALIAGVFIWLALNNSLLNTLSGKIQISN